MSIISPGDIVCPDEELIEAMGSLEKPISNLPDNVKEIVKKILDFYESVNFGMKFTSNELVLELFEKKIGMDFKLDELLSFDKSNENWPKKIEEAIEKGNIIPFYQGIVDNKTGKIEKYEALIRCFDGEKFLSPNIFLSSIKNTHVWENMVNNMLLRVIKDMKNYSQCIHINLLEQDLLNKKTIELLVSNLEYYNIDFSRLTIEVVEDEILYEDKTFEILKKLKDHGIKVSIDDFGKGFSKFKRFIVLKADELKINGDLIKNIHNNKSNLNIVKGITYLAHSKGMKVVAEYVENEDIQNIVKEIGIDYSQGYYFSKPGLADFN